MQICGFVTLYTVQAHTVLFMVFEKTKFGKEYLKPEAHHHTQETQNNDNSNYYKRNYNVLTTVPYYLHEPLIHQQRIRKPHLQHLSRYGRYF